MESFTGQVFDFFLHQASVCSDSKTADTSSTKTQDSVSTKQSQKDINRRRYTHHIPPPSEIQTRGAKLPKYSFEKRTHKKIMIVEGSQKSFKAEKNVSFY